MDMDISAYTSQITNSAVNKTGDNWSKNDYTKATDEELMEILEFAQEIDCGEYTYEGKNGTSAESGQRTDPCH